MTGTIDITQTGDITTHVTAVARRAKDASRVLATVTTETKNAALDRIARALENEADVLLAANVADVADARALLASGEMAPALLDRLVMDASKLRSMITSVRAVAALEDPAGRVLERTLLDDGLELQKVSCPLGVVAAIFEARPDAVTQIAALAIKSGNAVVLKGGREAERTVRALVRCMRDAVSEGSALPPDAICAVEGRAAVDVLLELDDLIDLIVPRGSNALVRSIQERTRIAVLGHAAGICHIYIDASADTRMAVDIVLDAKVDYPAACNAVETVLIHADSAPHVLAPLVTALQDAGVEVRACERTRALVPRRQLVAATADDWGTEFGALVIAIKVVDDGEEAIEHVNRYSSQHTDAIITSDEAAADRFLSHVDSASVFHNASTRFADGYRYGLGAEVGISTGKVHARGPVGLTGLATYKYLLYGSGQTVAPYTGQNGRKFLHAVL